MSKPTIDQTKKEIILGILDTYHDFCKSERTSAGSKKAKQVQESDEDSKTDESRVKIMRDYIPKLLHQTYDNFGEKDKYQNTVKTLSNNHVTTVSHLEYQTVDYFESQFESDVEAHLEMREYLTFQSILDAYNKAGFNEDTTPLWKKYKDSSDIRVLEIQKGKLNLDKDKSYANILANFILNYFFMTAKSEFRITFDAGQNIVGDLFTDIEQVGNLIMPQNISDSAVTSLGKLGGPNEFYFPSKNQKTAEVTSNILSKEKYSISFLNNGFSDKKPFGFKMEIKEKGVADPASILLPFSASNPPQTEGPSVNYLIDITEKAEKGGDPHFGSIQKKGSILSLGAAIDGDMDFKHNFVSSMAQHKNGLLLDLKRSGDHEQVLAAKFYNTENPTTPVLFCTIDILCALKARLEKMNCILQLKDRIILYRNPRALSAQAQEAKAIQLKKEGAVILGKLKSLPDNLKAKLKEQIVHFRSAKKASVDLRKILNKTDPQYICEKTMTALIRIKMLDLEEVMSTLAESETAILMPTQEEMTVFETTFDPESPMDVNAINQQNRLIKQKYNLAIQSIGYSLNIQSNGAVLDIEDKKMFEFVKNIVDGSYFTGESLPLYWFYFEPYKQFYDIMTFAYELKTTSKPRDFYVKMKNILSEKGQRMNGMDYFATINTLLDQFGLAKVYKPKLTEIMDFYATARARAVSAGESLPDVMIELFLGKTGGDKGICQRILDYYDELKQDLLFEDTIDVPQAGGGSGSMIQTPVYLDQYVELHNLLRRVSAKAAAFIEDNYSTIYPDRLFLTSVVELFSQLNGTKTTYDYRRIEDRLAEAIQEGKKTKAQLVQTARRIYAALGSYVNSSVFEASFKSSNIAAIASVTQGQQSQLVALSTKHGGSGRLARTHGARYRPSRLFASKTLEIPKSHTMSSEPVIRVTNISKLDPVTQLFLQEYLSSLPQQKKRMTVTRKKGKKSFIPLEKQVSFKGSKKPTYTEIILSKPFVSKKPSPKVDFSRFQLNKIYLDHYPSDVNTQNKTLYSFIRDFYNSFQANQMENQLHTFVKTVSFIYFHVNLRSNPPLLEDFLATLVEAANNQEKAVLEDEDYGDYVSVPNLVFNEVFMDWFSGLHLITNSTDYSYVLHESEALVSRLFFSNMNYIEILYHLTTIENYINTDKISYFETNKIQGNTLKQQWNNPFFLKWLKNMLPQGGGAKKTRKAVYVKGEKRGYTKKH